MFTAGQIVAHLVGDYMLQTNAMAQRKHKEPFYACIHGGFYTLPFLLITLNPLALLLIAVTHAIVDHYRLARYVIYLREFITDNPFIQSHGGGGSSTSKSTGSPVGDKNTPEHVRFYVYVAVDNTIHILTNGLILAVLA